MQRSQDHIVTTHVGSLPRPAEMVDLLKRRDGGEAVDLRVFEATAARAIAQAVKRQAEIGIDVMNDGEAAKSSYATYIQERLTGFGPVERERWPVERNPDREEFAEFYARPEQSPGTATRRMLACTGPIAPRDPDAVTRELAHLKAALAATGRNAAFVSAASPGVVARFHPNFHYKTTAEYRAAIGAAMRGEYEAIVAAGHILQLDCPDLASGRLSAYWNVSEAEFVRECHTSIEILNDALRTVPKDRVRLHVCWGNYAGPHLYDIALEAIMPAVLRAKAQVLSFEGANPRHAHEWEVWRRFDIGEDRVLMPGVIDTATNFVEHPELVAQRIETYARVVGRERVIAGVDCGFETFAGRNPVEAKVAWKKLEALVEGARIASKRLWGKA